MAYLEMLWAKVSNDFPIAIADTNMVAVNKKSLVKEVFPETSR